MCEYCENTFSNKRNKNIMEGELKTFTGVPLCKFRTYLDVNQFDNTPELKTNLFTYENYTEPENGTKLRELVISGGIKEINYCPYCGRRLNFKAPKLRSMREIYDTFGWKPEGWSVDDINEELKLPEIENNETIKIDFNILDPKNFLDSIGYYDSPCKNCSSNKVSCCCPEWLEWNNKNIYKEED